MRPMVQMMVLVEVWFRRFFTWRCGIWRFSSERFVRNRIFLRRPFDWQFLYRRLFHLCVNVDIRKRWCNANLQSQG